MSNGNGTTTNLYGVTSTTSVPTTAASQQEFPSNEVKFSQECCDSDLFAAAADMFELSNKKSAKQWSQRSIYNPMKDPSWSFFAKIINDFYSLNIFGKRAPLYAFDGGSYMGLWASEQGCSCFSALLKFNGEQSYGKNCLLLLYRNCFFLKVHFQV